MKKKEVYIVFCVDTEGPLYESYSELIKRVNTFFHLEFSEKKDLNEQLAAINDDSLRNRVKIFTQGRLINNFGDIIQLKFGLDKATDIKNRNTVLDSSGKGLIYSWFILDHVGYTENPRRRLMGHHAIYDFYKEYLNKECDVNDSLQFHYHPMPFNRCAHACATYYFNDNHLNSILTRKVIDKTFFPSAYRPGFHTIRPDSNWFLEQWIPFDYSNQACNSASEPTAFSCDQFGDWRRAPKIWGGYHPDHDDYQKQGNCRRWIFRCLNIDSRIRTITVDDIAAAFDFANENGSAILAVTDHDFRDMTTPFYVFINEVRRIAEEKNCNFFFENAVTAARKFCNLSPEGSELSAELININDNHHILKVNARNKIFGPQPYLSIKTKGGNYYYDNFDFDGINPDTAWSYTFSWESFPLNSVESIGIATNSPSGVAEVLSWNPKVNTFERNVCKD